MNIDKEEINRKRREYYREHYAEMRSGILKRKKKYRDNHKKELARKRAQDYQALRRKVKAIVLSHYGDRCVCCGEKHEEFLTIDHIHSGGNRHRREIKRTGTAFYSWIIKNNFPTDLRILCYNCNFGRRQEHCPHEKEVKKEQIKTGVSGANGEEVSMLPQGNYKP